MSIYGNSQIKMSFCFIVEYLNVKVIRNFRDADTPYLYGLSTSIPSSVLCYAFVKDIHKVQKVMLNLFTDLHHCTPSVNLCHHNHAQWNNTVSHSIYNWQSVLDPLVF